MHEMKKTKRNVTKLIACMLAIVCVMQTVMPADVKADTGSYQTMYPDEDYTYDESTCTLTLLPSGMEKIETDNLNWSDGEKYCNAKYVVIPDGVTRLGSYAFAGFYSAVDFSIPDSVTYIGDNAFESCESLTEFTVPDGVTYLSGNRTFFGCTSLKSVTISENVKNMVIDKTTFENCESLKTVTISGKGTTIKELSFWLCSSDCNNVLSSIVINDADVTLEPLAFNQTWVKKVTLPEGLTTIPEYAFGGCEKLTSINIPSTVTSIGECAFWNCTNLKKVTFKKNTSASKKLTIGSCAFSCCESLTSVTVNRNVKSIELSAFTGCNSIKKITIKGNVDKIKRDAFGGAFSLERIIITGNVGKTGYIFNYGCLKKVEIRGTLGSGLKKIQAEKIIVNGKTYKWTDKSCTNLVLVSKK